MSLNKSNESQADNSSDPPNPSQSCITFRRPETRNVFELWKKGVPLQLILSHLAPTLDLPEEADDTTLWRMLISILEPPPRKRLTEYNTIEDAVQLIRNSHNIMVLSGAGISTSAGIPDFRSRNGIYVQIHAEHPDLEDPKSMFEISYFKKNPLPFYRFARALYPGQFEPTIGHKFIKCIENHEKLLRNYSQNIDTLEKQANINRVIECHGSFAKASCTNCGYCVDGELIKKEVMEQKVPLCPKCKVKAKDQTSSSVDGSKLAVMKPNIVFFGEQLGDEFHNSLDSDKDALDLLIVIGSSLKVRPVAMIPHSVPPQVPQILINKEPLDNFVFDIELLGNCDEIIQELCLRLGDDWSKICNSDTKLMTEVPTIDITTTVKSKNFSEPDQVLKSELCNKDEEEKEPKREAREKEEDCDDSTDEWEDMEIVQSSSESLDSYMIDKAPIDIATGSYVQVAPGKYLFHGAELTHSQFAKYTKDKKITSPKT